MGRKTKPRQNYMQDAIVMRRTIDAVDADTDSNPAWKEAVKTHLQAALRLFLEHKTGNSHAQG